MEANLRIGGNNYRVQVPGGQEQRLNIVAKRVDDAITELRKAAGHMDRDRLLVMAALMIADTLYDLELKQQTEQKTIAAFHAGLADRLEAIGRKIVAA